MRQLNEHPVRTLGGLLVVAFVLFMLSGIASLRDAKAGLDLVLGDICWFGFLLTALLFVIGGVYSLVRFATRGRQPA
ncbi:MAG TPA: hypothetical protein VFJ19_19120 [Nocardioidaceae bacterium]|nr:hypothetical protein [Nocardioidaceae bacterium]